jgi:2-polyprenyl-3-methyl-5-hydroxy-6-metoxy-1,4-benzoquinol methylase
MDAPHIERSSHLQALAGLRRINRISRAAAFMGGPVIAFARRRGLQRVRLLDIASGGGDVPIALAKLARRAGLEINATLTDISPVALEFAQLQAQSAGLDVTTRRVEAVTETLDGPFDVITSSLFLHHLQWTDAVRVLENMRRAAGDGQIVVSDLRRATLGLFAAHLGCRLLSRSSVVHFDGPASVRAGWTIEEMRGLATEAGLSGAAISRRWPWRILLTWEG